MKTLKTLLVLGLAINVSLLAPQLFASSNSDQEARADFKQHLDNAKELLDDGQWVPLAAEAQNLADRSKSFGQRSGESAKEHRAIEQHAKGLAAAARAEDRAKSTEQYNALATCFQADAHPGDVDADNDRETDADKDADNTERNVRDRNNRTLTPLDQGNSKADVNTTAQIRKEIIAGKNMSVNARNVKIITSEGKVTLRGPVNTPREKRIIGEIADRIARSENVDNQLEVKLTTSSNYSTN